MFFVIFELALILHSIFPVILTKSELLVIHVISYVKLTLIRILVFFPVPLTVSKSVGEASFVIVIVFPGVFSNAMRSPLVILTGVEIPIRKLLKAVTLFQTLYKFSFVSISVDPNVDPEAISVSIFPFSNIVVSFNSSPRTRAMFDPILPLAVVGLSVGPLIVSFAMLSTIEKTSFIASVVGINIKPLVLEIFNKLTVKESS